MRRIQVRNWNGFPEVAAEVYDAASRHATAELTHRLPQAIHRGMGRSYGDASLGDRIIQHGADQRLLHWDPTSGILEAEAGLSLDELLGLMVPRGWFVRVTPGTRFVTLGGAVAADVHGKNHHVEGSFYDSVDALTLALPDGRIIRCSRTEHADLFTATFGGMGLTGAILTVRLRLRRIETAYILQHSLKARDLDHIFSLFERHAQATYSVAWIDCLAKGGRLGRSVLLLGEHAAPTDLPTSLRQRPLQVHAAPRLTVPFYPPSGLLNSFTIRWFNRWYYARHRHDHRSVVHYGPFFYPLDAVYHWNRMYGRRGFVQYQFVLPSRQGYDGVREILAAMADYGQASFLAVLKKFGPGNEAPLSFPMEGYTLAVDFPITDRLWPFLRRLDEIVIRHGGRLYLAKDARMPREVFEAGYPEHGRFKRLLEAFPRRPESHLSRRLGL